MRHKPPHRRTLDNLTTFTVTLTAAELIRWHRLAKKDSLTFEQLAKRSVERAIADD